MSSRSDEAARLTLLEDRQEIRDLVATYCRAVDRVDLEALRSVYTPDGVDHHTGFDGTVGEFIDFLAQVLPALEGTQHIIGNHLAEIHGDEAVAETYGTAVHWGTPSDEAALNWTSGFRYVDHLVRTTDGWRVKERWAIREWAVSFAGRQHVTANQERRGRDSDEPLWSALQRLRGENRG